jgi:hypothetical protein
METIKKTQMHHKARDKAFKFKSTRGYNAAILDTKSFNISLGARISKCIYYAVP